MLTEENRLKILKLLEAQPHLSQRKIALELNISLGKVNFCVRALIDKGLIKAENFQKSPNKTGYLYLLTPKGVEDKITLTHSFLQRKLKEYEALEKEIEQLRKDASL
ncbi:MarR family EPS-associated transcriptional regulator [Marinomonas sp.]